MKKILVYPIGELSEKRLSRLIELELLERGAEVTWEADENVDQAIYVVGVLDDDAMETVNNTAVGAEKVVCCRYQEADSDGIIVIERPIDAAKLADGLTRSYKKEKDPRGLVIDDDPPASRAPPAAGGRHSPAPFPSGPAPPGIGPSPATRCRAPAHGS